MVAQELISKQGFSREERLLKAADYSWVFGKPTYKASDGAFLILVRENELSFSRLGLAVSKKSIKTAVGRNRVKRVIRDFFRHNKGRLSGFDFVLVSRQGLNNLPNKKLVDRLQRRWSELEAKCAQS